MDLTLSPSEQLLQTTARSFVEREAAQATLLEVQAADAGTAPGWREAMAAAGWLGLLVPHELGGMSATALETAIVAEELGRGPVPGPFLFSSVISARLINACNPSKIRDETLKGIANGEMVVAPAMYEPRLDWEALRNVQTALVTSGGDGCLNGSKVFVPYAEEATHLLVPVAGRSRLDPPAFAVISCRSEGLSYRRLTGLIAWSYEVTFDDVAVDLDGLLTLEEGFAGIDVAFDWVYPILSAFQVGGCQSLLDRSVSYSNTRIQFGQPIGRFQRVQDHIVGLLNALDAARWATYEALWRVDSNGGARPSAHMAKAVASESYHHCANAAHEVHAGIGSDPNFGITLYTQMSRSLYDYLGNPRWHRRQMARALAW